MKPKNKNNTNKTAAMNSKALELHEELICNFKNFVISSKSRREKQHENRAATLEQTKALQSVVPTKLQLHIRNAHQSCLLDHLRSLRMHISIKDFTILEILGNGGYGMVYKAMEKKTGNIYALKQVPKNRLLNKNARVRMYAERDILTRLNSKYVVHLEYTFQDSENLYQVLEYLQGKSLMYWLEKLDKFNEETVKFYIAELVKAVQTVQEIGYVHRDIKPDNLVLTASGHLKLLDFGLSKYTSQMISKYNDKSNKLIFKDIEGCTIVNSALRQPSSETLKSRCGTIYYQAPEVLMGKEYDCKVDWWAVGLIMFECLYGGIPFIVNPNIEISEEKRLELIRASVICYKKTCPIPFVTPSMPCISDDAIDLMRSLICEPQHRLTGPDIMAHPWFKGINFETLHSQAAPLEAAISQMSSSDKRRSCVEQMMRVPSDSYDIPDLLFSEYEFLRPKEDRNLSIENIMMIALRDIAAYGRGGTSR